jgi:hypothetical protein
MKRTDSSTTYKYNNTIDMFIKRHLSSGAEGKVYIAQFIHPRYAYDKIIIKEINVAKKADGTSSSEDLNHLTTDKLYTLFFNKQGNNKPYLTEIICQTLVNQIVYQGIAPSFALNLYWDFSQNPQQTITTYNDFATGQDFDEWARHTHSYETWCNALFQIMYGILAMRRYFNMVHSDLHPGNVLVQKVTPGGFWKFIIDNQVYNVPNLGYVFLIHDFGYAWIPGKMIPVKWHYDNTLKYITESGKEFFDIQRLLDWLNDFEDFKVPEAFQTLVAQNFRDEELKYIMTKRYYRLNPEEAKEQGKYPNITQAYRGLHTTIKDKIHKIFYPMYRGTVRDAALIETYSLDKRFDKRKLPSSLQRLIQS